jgi:undecaprenyl-diphosphatase
MTDKLIPGEEEILFLINSSHTNFLDSVMWTFSSIKIWIPLAALIILNIIYGKSWKQWIPILLAFTLLFVLCDQFSSHLVKPLVARPRPTHYPGIMEHVRTLFDYTGGKSGFISGHATNSFGFAIFSTLLFRNNFYSSVVFLWAIIVVYSRMYLGVHFVSDILGGIISGLIIGYGIYYTYKYILEKIAVRNSSYTIAIFSQKQTRLLTIVLLSYLILLTIFSMSIDTLNILK